MARKDRSETTPGDVLGISHIDTPAANSEPRIARPATADEARRRRRMNEGADELVAGTQSTPAQHGGGAAGVDMGSGGEGTDIE
jgi:hypothetical protein